MQRTSARAMLVVAGYQRSTVPAGQEDFDTEYNSLRNVVDLQSKRSISEPGAAFGAPQAPFAEIMLERLTTADAPPEQPQTRPIVPLGDRAHAQTQQTDGGSTSSPPEDQRQASAAADCGTIVPSAGFGPSGGPRSARRPRLPKSAPLDQSCGPQVKSVSSYKQVPRTTVHSGNPPGRSRSGMRILR
jgi:hypothetical protein